jgi:hypothetical protein
VLAAWNGRRRSFLPSERRSDAWNGSHAMSKGHLAVKWENEESLTNMDSASQSQCCSRYGHCRVGLESRDGMDVRGGE